MEAALHLLWKKPSHRVAFTPVCHTSLPNSTVVGVQKKEVQVVCVPFSVLSASTVMETTVSVFILFTHMLFVSSLHRLSPAPFPFSHM